MNIKILGPGCPNCKKVEQIAREVVGELGVEATFEKVTDMAKITKYVMATPGLVVNEEVVCSGRIPSKAEVTSWITTALSRQEA